MKRLSQGITYFRKHIFAEFVAVGVVFFCLTTILIMVYLKNEYLTYLLDETAKTEKTIMEISVANLNDMLQDAVVTGAEIAIDQRLYSQVMAALEAQESRTREVQSLKYTLNSRTHYNNEIAAIAIVTENGLLCEYGRSWSQSGFGGLWEDDNLEVLEKLYRDTIKEKMIQKAGKYQISTVPNHHENFQDRIFFHIAYPLVGSNIYSESNVVVVITCQLSDIVAVTAMGEGKNQDIVEYITDAQGNVIYYKNHDYLGQNQRMPGEKLSTELNTKLNYFDWEVNTGIDKAAMEKKVWKMFTKGIIVYVLLFLGCVILWQLIMRGLLKPIRIISNAMEDVQEGNLEKQIEIRGEHEIWKLANQYNQTVGALKQQRMEAQKNFEEKMVVMERCNEAERSALEAQINAHFLFNTLNAINYTAMENDDVEVAELLKNLSNILYYSYSRKLKHVTLKDELRWVEQYLYLQKFRLMEVFDYEIRFPAEYEEWPCCKLFLQPFVENSIIHGFDGWDNGGMIRIIGTEEEGRLCIRIEDNGRGMSEEVAEEIRRLIRVYEFVDEEDETEIGIGIQNCVTRLRMYYGPDMDVTLESEEGKGTCFILRLPIPETFLEGNLYEEELI